MNDLKALYGLLLSWIGDPNKGTTKKPILGAEIKSFIDWLGNALVCYNSWIGLHD